MHCHCDILTGDAVAWTCSELLVSCRTAVELTLNPPPRTVIIHPPLTHTDTQTQRLAVFPVEFRKSISLLPDPCYANAVLPPVVCVSVCVSPKSEFYQNDLCIELVFGTEATFDHCVIRKFGFLQ